MTQKKKNTLLKNRVVKCLGKTKKFSKKEVEQVSRLFDVAGSTSLDDLCELTDGIEL